MGTETTPVKKDTDSTPEKKEIDTTALKKEIDTPEKKDIKTTPEKKDTNTTPVKKEVTTPLKKDIETVSVKKDTETTSGKNETETTSVKKETETAHIKGNDVEKCTNLEEKIIRQIEYYFGNYNLGRDKFLKEVIQEDDGWVPLETMVRFNRLKSLSDDFNAIAEALRKSPNQLMEVNVECTKIRRKIPLPENSDKSEIDDRSLYVKGFNRNTKLDEVLDFFKVHKVENVMMRKRRQGNRFLFKGSVFATFETVEACEEFLNKAGIKFGNVEVLKEKKKDYVKRKDIFYDNLRAEKAKRSAERKENDEEISNVEFTKDCLLRVSGLGKETTREDIKKATETYGTVVYVDYSKGKEDAIVRFDEAVASNVLKAAEEENGEKKLMVESIKATIHPIEGEDEEKYWKVVAEAKLKRRQMGHGNKQGNRGRFNKKHHGKRFHGRNRDDASEGEPPRKRSRSNFNLESEIQQEKMDTETKQVETETVE